MQGRVRLIPHGDDPGVGNEGDIFHLRVLRMGIRPSMKFLLVASSLVGDVRKPHCGIWDSSTASVFENTSAHV